MATTESSPHSFPLGLVISGVLVAFLLTLVNRFIGMVVSFPTTGVIGHGISILYLGALLAALVIAALGVAQLRRSTPFLLIVGLAFALPMATVLVAQRAELVPPGYLYLTANNLFLPIGALLVGAAIGKIIKHPNTLLAGAAFAIFFDLVVVTMGTVAKVMESGSQLIATVSLGAGSQSTRLSPFAKSIPILSGVTIGPADILFLALFLGAVAQMPQLRPDWNLSVQRTARWMYGLLFLALILVETTYLPVPALVPMGIAVLIANARHAAFTRQEKRDLVIGAIFAILCAVGMVAYGKYFAKHAAATAPQAKGPKWGWQLAVVRQTGEWVVLGVVPEMPVAAAGIKPGDVIESLNGISTKTFRNTEDLQAALRGAENTGLKVRLRRLGEKKPLDVVVNLL